MGDVAPMMAVRQVLQDRSQATGSFRDADGLAGTVIEPIRQIWLQDPVASFPQAQAVDRDYRAGPTFILRQAGGYADRATGFAFTSGRDFIRETAMVEKYAARAGELFPGYDFDAATPVEGLAAVISNQRGPNYCRWWLDTLSKLYLFETFAGDLPEGSAIAQWVTAPVETGFQKASLDLLGLPGDAPAGAGRLIRGDLLLSAGLTFKGGQNISPLARDFGAYAVRKAGLARTAAVGRGRRIFISRQFAKFRRIRNETALHEGLTQRGFEIIALERLPLKQQIEAFVDADVVVAPHGAGLTNLLFCQAGGLLIEIFPEGGVHSSAFRRIASNLDIRYALYTGPMAGVAPKDNPRNVDLVVDTAHLFGFIDTTCGAFAP